MASHPNLPRIGDLNHDGKVSKLEVAAMLAVAFGVFVLFGVLLERCHG
jgi:hypothetical protein